MAPPVTFAFLSLLLLFLHPVSVSAWTADGWAFSRSRGETNGQRLARGLPPLPPRKLYDATRTGPALARRSVAPGSHIAATIVGQSTPICAFDGDSQECSPPVSAGIPFTVPSGAGYSGVQDLTVTSGTYMGRNLVAVSYNDPPTLTTTNGNILEVAVLANYASQPGDTPVYDANEMWYTETAIYHVDSQGDITANWINPDTSSVPLYFWIDGSGPSYLMFATGDPSVITSNGYTQVTLSLV